MQKKTLLLAILLFQVFFSKCMLDKKNISKISERSYKFEHGEYSASLDMIRDPVTKKFSNIFIPYKWPTDENGTYTNKPEILKETEYPEINEIYWLMIQFWIDDQAHPPLKICKKAFDVFADVIIETVS